MPCVRLIFRRSRDQRKQKKNQTNGVCINRVMAGIESRALIVYRFRCEKKSTKIDLGRELVASFLTAPLINSQSQKRGFFQFVGACWYPVSLLHKRSLK